MAKFKTRPLDGQGFDMDTDLVISDLENFDHLKTNSTTARFFDDGRNFVEFKGSGFNFKFDDGFLVDVRGGTIKSLTIREDGITTASISGLKLSASKLFDLYAGDNIYDAIDYLSKGSDRITGTRLDDNLSGAAGKDRIDGGGGDDRILGGLGNDVLKGGAGDDFLSGEMGSDTLTGGAGADTFAFYGSTAPFSGEVITDFNRNQNDKIALYGFSEDMELFTRQEGGNTILEGSPDGGETVELTITLRGLHELVLEDFVF